MRCETVFGQAREWRGASSARGCLQGMLWAPTEVEGARGGAKRLGPRHSMTQGPSQRFLISPHCKGLLWSPHNCSGGGGQRAFSRVVFAQSVGQLLHLKKQFHHGLGRVILPSFLLGERPHWCLMPTSSQLCTGSPLEGTPVCRVPAGTLVCAHAGWLGGIPPTQGWGGGSKAWQGVCPRFSLHRRLGMEGGSHPWADMAGSGASHGDSHPRGRGQPHWPYCPLPLRQFCKDRGGQCCGAARHQQHHTATLEAPDLTVASHAFRFFQNCFRFSRIGNQTTAPEVLTKPWGLLIMLLFNSFHCPGWECFGSASPHQAAGRGDLTHLSPKWFEKGLRFGRPEQKHGWRKLWRCSTCCGCPRKRKAAPSPYQVYCIRLPLDHFPSSSGSTHTFESQNLQLRFALRKPGTCQGR